MDYSRLPRHHVICVDMVSFYASCEAVSLGLDPLKAKVVVVGDINRNGSVVLAASPKMKEEHGIKTGSRLYEVKNIKDPEIIIKQARMGYYFSTSQKIQSIFQSFVPEEAIHVYSVDESWLTLDGTERLWGNAWEASEKIIKKIKDETGIVSRIGIGDNKFQAKLCLDIYGKKHGIAECHYEDMIEMFHHLPVEEVWGIGERIKTRLNKMGVYTIGELAHHSEKELVDEFGIYGTQMKEYSWGIDRSPVIYDKDNPPSTAFGFAFDDNSKQTSKSVGRSVVLLRDYYKKEDVQVVIKDLVDEVGEILRRRKLEGKTIHLSIDYSYKTKKKGFSRQRSFKNYYTNNTLEIYDQCLNLLDKFYSQNTPVRQVRVSVANLQPEVPKIELDTKKDKLKKAQLAMDTLNDKFGKGSVRSGNTLKAASISKDRYKKVGGHYEK